MKDNATSKLGIIADVTPKQMVSVFEKNPPIQAKTIVEEHYNGLYIQTEGVITCITVFGSFVEIGFTDKDGVLLACNFKKPVTSEISFLEIGDSISVAGTVYNVGREIVVLDNCKTTSESEDLPESENVPETNNAPPKNGEQTHWWEKTWVQGIMLLGAIAGILGLGIWIF